MNKYLAQLGDLPWSQVFMFGFLAAAVYYFLLFDDGSELHNRLQQATAQLSESKKKLEETKTAMADAERFEAEVKAAVDQFNKIIEFMPESMSQAELTTIVSRQASQSGAKVTRIEPATASAVRTDNYDPVRVKMNMQGSFVQIVSFLSNISRVPKMLTFDKLDVALPDSATLETPQLDFEAILVGYRYLKNANKPADGQNAANGEATNAVQ